MSEFSAFTAIQLITLFGVTGGYHLGLAMEVAAVFAGSAGCPLVPERLLAEVAALCLAELLVAEGVPSLHAADVHAAYLLPTCGACVGTPPPPSSAGVSSADDETTLQLEGAAATEPGNHDSSTRLLLSATNLDGSTGAG